MRQEGFPSKITYFEISGIGIILLIIGMTSFMTINTKKNLSYDDFIAEICFLIVSSLLLWIYFHINLKIQKDEML